MHATPVIRNEFNAATLFGTALGAFTISGNRLRSTATATSCLGGHIQNYFWQDQYSESRIVTYGAGAESGVILRLDITNQVGYVVHAATGNGVILLEMRPGYSIFNVGTFTATDPTAPFTLRGEIIGDGVHAFVNGSPVGSFYLPDVIGTAEVLSGTPGVSIFNNTAVANTEIETWEAGPLPAGYAPGARASFNVGNAERPPMRHRMR